MEHDKRLDFNQPFLSVRRPSLPVSSSESDRRADRKLPKVSQPPPYRSELKSGPLRNPGTVPFTWEQSPGRPKYERTLPDRIHQQLPPVAPKLPPGRTPNPNRYESDRAKQDSVPAENPIAKQECPSECTEVVPSSDADQEVYFDAPDHLSRSESFFYNCSISGLSGLDGPDLASTGRFATDPQVQDFMMGRFLPAAKAMASETPPHSHAPKKQPPPAAREQPRPQLRKTSNGNHPQHPLLRYNSSFLSRYMAQASLVEGEDDDETEPEAAAPKVCGLLPRFLLKSSFCIPDGEQDTMVQNAEKHTLKRKPKQRFAHRRDRYKPSKADLSGKIRPSAKQSVLPHEEDKGAEEKDCTSFRDLLANEGEEWRTSSGSRGPVIERTLYIDSVRTRNSHSSDMSLVSGPPSYRGIEFDVYAANDKKEIEAASIEPIPLDIKEISTVDDKEFPGNKAEEDPMDSGSNKVEQPSPFDSKHHGIKHIVILDGNQTSGVNTAEPDKLNCSELGKFLTKEITSAKRSTTITNPSDEKIDTECESTTTTKNHGNNNSRPRRPTFHIPPLLPKSPAESWLHRTLPSVTSRGSPARFSPSGHEPDRSQSIIVKTAQPPSDRLLAPIAES